MRRVVAFTGPSNSGKTTLIEKIAKILVASHKVAIVKNDPSDKARFDVEGKDSYKFFATGAEVAVVSPTRSTVFSHKTRSVDQLITLFDDFDYLIVEGLKNLPIPRIGVFRGELVEDYFAFIGAVAVDSTVDTSALPSTIDLLDINSPDQVINWINNNAKEV